MGIEWGKRKFFVSNDEENSGVGFTFGFPPLVFSIWSKKHAIDFTEEPIYVEECLKCETPLKVATGIGPYCPNKECPVIDGFALLGR